MRSLCVFCGSNSGSSPIYRETAEQMGRELARRQIRLVYGGGRVGMMGFLADATLAAGGEVCGVIPSAMVELEWAHPDATEMRVVPSMHARKALMAELSDAFVALPGGFGTFEEICEVITWTQLGLHSKPCALLNVNGFYDGLIGQFDQGVREGFIRPEHRQMVLVHSDIGTLLEGLQQYRHQSVSKHIPNA